MRTGTLYFQSYALLSRSNLKRLNRRQGTIETAEAGNSCVPGYEKDEGAAETCYVTTLLILAFPPNDCRHLFAALVFPRFLTGTTGFVLLL